ncbi:FG-GAP repeat protein, partial [bacterium AH-315-J23]|nr:FG-GAP repeat protein [bacterium AH-315-J23]
DEGFIIQGDAAGDNAASSVSSAGDINGDGFDDLIVGAPRGDDGGTFAGEAYVIYGRATGPVVDQIITGTAGAENLVGGAGNDIITGNGGADVFRGGAGDDRIITSTLFADIDGGRGTDTLVLSDTSQTLDLTILNPAEIQSIERIQITDGSATGNTLVLDRLAVLDITEQRSNGTVTLIVDGTNTGTVDFSDTGWTANGTIVIDSNTYDIYENGNATVQVQQGIAVTVNSNAELPFVSKSSVFEDFSVISDSKEAFGVDDRDLVEPDKRAVSKDYLDSDSFKENSVDDDFETPEFTHIITDESFSVTESLDLNLGRNAQPEISTKFLAEFRANYEYDGFVDSPNDFDINGIASTDLVELENRVVTRSGENSDEIQTIRLVPEVLPPVIAEDLTDILPMNLEPTWDDIEFLSDRQAMLDALPIGDDLT